MAELLTALTGPWQLRPVERFNQGFYARDDTSWLSQDLPAHWQQHPELRHHAGKVVYRRRFELPQGEPERRRWLRIGGSFYWTRPFFNGVDLGLHEGYFIPIEHEITRLCDTENELLLEIDCPDQPDRDKKRLLTGVFSHWDCLDPTTNPGGPWLPIEVYETGPLTIRDVRLWTEQASAERAILGYQVLVDSAVEGFAGLDWLLTPLSSVGPTVSAELGWELRLGEQWLEGTLVVERPQLWWTHDLGTPHLYRAAARLWCDCAVSDERAFDFGIRTFVMQDWIAYLNGERLLIKGNNYAPGDTRIATMNAERATHDLDLARSCHLNMLRVHAHVDHPALYEAADRAGVLIWQDMPLQWGYSRAIADEAPRQAREMVSLLGNHPSVVLWCGHNEAFFVGENDTKMSRTLVEVFTWSWEREVLDGAVAEALEDEDAGRRPVVRSSGEFRVPGLHSGTDTHFYFGWYSHYGALRRFDMVMKLLPDNIRFITEFGAQSFPNLESCRKFMAENIEEIDWELLKQRHSFQPEMMALWYDWRSSPSLEALVERSQAYQSELNRFYIDRLRLRKYHPVGGIVPFMFHDPNPAVLWSVIDYWRVPKASYWALRDAFRPQYIFTILDRDRYAVGAELDLSIYLVNDAHRHVHVEASATLISPDGDMVWSQAAAVDLASDCLPFARWRINLIPSLPGPYVLELSIRNADDELVNRYIVDVQPASM